MRILFDGFWWVRGPYSNRQVLREIIFEWERAHPEDELIVAVRGEDLPMARSELPDRVRLVGTRLFPQGVSAILELPFVARRVAADITLTHNFTPLWGRSAVFIHDLMFVTNPEWFTRKELLYFALMPMTAPRADIVLTSSRTEARRIDRVLGRRDATTAVGLGVPNELMTAGEEPIAQLEGLAGFVLVVGRLNVRKNLAVAIEGALASGRVDSRHPIVVIGERDGRRATFPPRIQSAITDGRVRFTGFVSSAQLAWAYRRAGAFLFPSRDEGFGIPAIEALAFGAPVVASDIEVFRELLGDRATYADPDAPEAMARALTAVLDRAAIDSRPTSVSPAVLEYDWPNVVEKLHRRISGAIESHKYSPAHKPA